MTDHHTPDPGPVPEGMVHVGWWHEKSGVLSHAHRHPAGLSVPLGDRYDLCPILPVFAPIHDHDHEATQ